MANELAVYNEMPVMELGKVLAKSGFFADARDASQAIVKVLAGRELGFGPIASMTGFHIIKGRVSMSANLMGAAVKGHPKYDYRVTRMDDDACEIVFYEGGEKIGVSGFTAKDAQKAGTQNMGKFPRNMLFARAMSNGVKWFCPDVMNGQPVYTPDELGGSVDENGDYEIIDAEPLTRQAIPEQEPEPKPKSQTRLAVEARVADLTKVLMNTGLDDSPKKITDEMTDAQAIAIGKAMAETIENHINELRSEGIVAGLDGNMMPTYDKAHGADQLVDEIAALRAMVKAAQSDD